MDLKALSRRTGWFNPSPVQPTAGSKILNPKLLLAGGQFIRILICVRGWSYWLIIKHYIRTRPFIIPCFISLSTVLNFYHTRAPVSRYFYCECTVSESAAQEGPGSLPSSQSCVRAACVLPGLSKEIIRAKAESYRRLFIRRSLYLLHLPGSALMLWSFSSSNKAQGSAEQNCSRSPNHSLVYVCVCTYVHKYILKVCIGYRLACVRHQIFPQGLILHQRFFFLPFH